MRHQPVGILRTLAREMRQGPTSAERAAWEALRNRRCLGYRFKRQVVIEGLIVDFYCRELRLAIEIDGAVHDTLPRRVRDQARDEHLQSREIRVLHIPNANATRAHLLQLLKPLALRPPSPLAGEGERG